MLDALFGSAQTACKIGSFLDLLDLQSTDTTLQVPPKGTFEEATSCLYSGDSTWYVLHWQHCTA